jgi:DNA polymerase-3 subunit epsilon
VNDYLLFIDTEASGLPKNWNLPYDSPGNWPYCVQISWLVFTKEGRKIKEENHYIKDSDFIIDVSATKVHGITRDLLEKKGEYRKVVLQLLQEDFTRYNPLAVGHFMQFDLHMLGADYYRAEMGDPIKNGGIFCTMLGSKHLVKNPALRFLRLDQLYEMLFKKRLEHSHDALVDAGATAACFFEMMKRGEINEEIITQQQKEFFKKKSFPEKYGCLPMISLIFLTVLILYNL